MRSLLSLAYMCQARDNCLLLFMHWIPWAFILALLNAGKSIAARIAMIAITTSSSIKVKPAWVVPRSNRWLKGRRVQFISFYATILLLYGGYPASVDRSMTRLPWVSSGI